MGNYFYSSLNSKNSDNSQSKQNKNNSKKEKDSDESKEELDKLIPYSYTPEQEEEKEKNLNNKKGTLKCIRVIKGHHKWCNCLKMLKSGNLCSCSGDRSINIYSNDNNYNVILNIPECHTDFILYVLELNDFIIASSSSDGTIKFWKIIINNNINNNKGENTFYLIETIFAHESDVWKILFIPKKSQLISCGSDTLIKIWDLIIYKQNNNKYSIDYVQNKVISDHIYWVSSIINVKNINKNINYLVSGSGDNTIKFYNVLNNYNFVHSMNKVICCQQGTLVNYTNKKFIIGGGRGILFFVVNFIYFQVESKIYGGNEEINTILVLKRNKINKKNGFLLGGKERCFHYLDEYEYRNKIVKSNSHEKYVYCLIQLNDNLIASSSYDNDIKIWKYDEFTFD